MTMAWMTGLAALLFAAVHLFIGRLHWLETNPRSSGLSFAGGVAVAYVFLHILPNLAEHQSELTEVGGMSIPVVERFAYGLALAGLALFYWVEKVVKLRRDARMERMEEEPDADAGVVIHLAVFTLFNLLIGYLLNHREEPEWPGLLVYTIALALHFVTVDFAMREHHKRFYDRVGRWLIAAAVLIGWALGFVIEVDQTLIGCLFAFLAGSVVLNVLKEELPEERESRFGPFLLGAAGYGALLFLEAGLA